MRLPLALLLVFISAPNLFAGDETETGKFLGPEAGLVRLELDTLNPNPALGGGDIAVEVSASGRLVVLKVWNRVAKRFELPLDREEGLALVKLVRDQDVLAVKVADRATSSAQCTIILENALGRRRSVSVRDDARTPALDRVVEALGALEKRTAGQAPVFEGEPDPNYRPFEGVEVTVVWNHPDDSGSFELTDPKDWEKLHSLLKDLPGAAGPLVRGPLTGYQGFRVSPRRIAVPELPKRLSVWKGVLEIAERPGLQAKKDKNGLETWLLAEARKRGIEVGK